ncbi:hypothetical protein J4T90_33400 (plasmid) [Sinorhizobium medicae]|uniref:hypothetical protein n=1 Tax=Sinorhizobium medicae TaxID=110321 RepID=UPI001AAD51AC|nr:hypothetical protein [Sinorhizobium medicae]MBO1944247.1 hypothetical protein [Sinorhizobium medicae]
MLTRILIAGALSVAIAPPVLAQADIVCDQAAMAKLETDIQDHHLPQLDHRNPPSDHRKQYR